MSLSFRVHVMGLGLGVWFRVQESCPKGVKYLLYIVECRVSIVGIHIMIWEGIPHGPP